MPVQHRPNSLRHPSADYSDPGIYYVTLCTQNRDPLFGVINNAEMQCNPLGSIVWRTWNHLPARFPGISIDSAIVMPDHFHGIIVIHDRVITVGAVHEPPLQTHPQPRRIMTIPLIIGYLKMNTAKRINQIRQTPGERVWQRGYYDKILRVDKDYDTLTEYILTNPARWGLNED